MSETSDLGTPDSPWRLTTPSGQSEFEAYRDESADPPALVVQVGKTQLRYALQCVDDLHAMLRAHGDWMALGNADEQKPAPDGSVEAWARSESNPVGGWYGLRKGYRAGSGTTSLRCSSASGWPRSNTTLGTTACGPSEPLSQPPHRKS